MATTTRATGGYSFALPESFDFNGTWAAYRDGSEDLLFRFTIQDNALISITCGSSIPIVFSSPPSIANGEFSFTGTIGSLSGRILATGQATGASTSRFAGPGHGAQEVGDSQSMAKPLVTFICLALVVVAQCVRLDTAGPLADDAVGVEDDSQHRLDLRVSFERRGNRIRRRRRRADRWRRGGRGRGKSHGDRVTVPAHPSGPVNVTVTDPSGGTAELSQGFSYVGVDPPVVTRISPAAGLLDGGNMVTVVGTGSVRTPRSRSTA